jgi:alkylhydroperoxidase/carboxymuconolactone decarboxylase family protein YurZ
MAGICTVCVAAASGTIAPLPAAARPLDAPTSLVSARYELTASTTALAPTTPDQQLFLDALNVASLPLQNLITISNALGGLTSIVGVLNTVYALVAAGKSDQVPAAIDKALAAEGAAFTTFLQLPQTIAATDTAAIAKLLANFSAPSAISANTLSSTVKTAAVTPAAVPNTSQVLLDAINVASLPLQNLITISNAVGGLTSIVGVFNTVYSLIAAGKSDQVPAAIDKALATEAAAFTTFLKLPQTIAATNTAAINKLLNNFAAPSAISAKTLSPNAITTDAVTTNAIATNAVATNAISTNAISTSAVSAKVLSPTVKTAAVTPAAVPNTSQVLLDAINVVSLPLQNLITVSNAIGGLTSIVGVFNTVYSLVAAGKSDQVPAAIQKALATEAAAFTTFLQLPQTIVATDTAAINKLLANFTAPSAISANTVSANTISLNAISPTVKTAAVTPAAAPNPSQVLLDATNVASLPLQNLITVSNAVGGLTGITGLPNTVYSLIVAGKSDQVPAAIDKALTAEGAAFTTFLKLPQTIAATDTAAVNKLLNNFGAGAPTVKAASITDTPSTSVGAALAAITPKKSAAPTSTKSLTAVDSKTDSNANSADGSTSASNSGVGRHRKPEGASTDATAGAQTPGSGTSSGTGTSRHAKSSDTANNASGTTKTSTTAGRNSGSSASGAGSSSHGKS